jgi:acyl-CoA synthetase (AMP-forming)/AMP-acid ligase II
MRDIVQHLLHWASEKPHAAAYKFVTREGAIASELSYRALLSRAQGVAATLRDRGSPGARAALVFVPGLEFLVAFFGCMLAGVIPVPMSPPRRLAERDSTNSIMRNCKPSFVLTTFDLSLKLSRSVAERAEWGALDWLSIDTITAQAYVGTTIALLQRDVAFLQYTSGSTSNPKGAMITHGNLSSNLAMMQRSFRTSSESVFVSWLPLFHDMGLTLNALHAVAVGACCILMAPMTFMQRPLQWLRTVSEYKADIAGAPNFAYDHCVDRLRSEDAEALNLTNWRVAFNGAEPVRQATLERFSSAFAPFGFDRRALFPCYGMAEATVMISGKTEFEKGPMTRNYDGGQIVACGSALSGEEIAIVDPDTRQRRACLTAGEIWIRGPNVAIGYWAEEEATEATFHARIEGEMETWLRTGDLGFLDQFGELFITGRLKDLIIIRGENHYPQDIEFTVKECHPALYGQLGVAFTTTGTRGESRLVVVQELSRKWRNRASKRDLDSAIREAVVKQHGIAAHQVVIVSVGAIPTTTSGKIQRARCRELWLANAYSVSDD